jgi:hypothetical protein
VAEERRLADNLVKARAVRAVKMKGEKVASVNSAKPKDAKKAAPVKYVKAKAVKKS